MSSTFYIVGIPAIILLFLQNVNSANIVFFFGRSTYSHRVPAWPLATSLAELGHNVTFVSQHPAKNPHPKVFDYNPQSLKEWGKDEDLSEIEDVFWDRKNGQLYKTWTCLPSFGIMACEKLYNDQAYIKWMKTVKVDLVILDSLSNDCAYGMIHYWGAKTILFSTTAPFTHYPGAYGLPDETSSISAMELFYPVPMSLFQRLTNALLPLAWQYYRALVYFPKLEEITREKLGIVDLPKFEDIERNTSLVLVNTHWSEEFPRSFGPNVIGIAGIALSNDKRKPLPKELNEFLEKGDKFIYVSFGSFADFSKMDTSTQQAFIGAFRKFPNLQFVWKVGNTSIAKEFPEGNVYVGKWMPQADILAHPKIQAFLTHSGLIGIHEAIHFQVPLLAIPLFAEQDYNAERIHRKEYGIRLEVTTITQSELEDAINRILTDPKYRNNMKRLSTLFKERPQTPLQTALWWTDFVLKHTQEDLAALRPYSVHQPWWIRKQLDVWMIIGSATIIILVTMLYFFVKLVKFIVCCLLLKKVDKSSKRKKD